MKGRAVLAVVCCLAVIMCFFSPAVADTVLFPVVVTNAPYVVTFVSVVNRGGGAIDPSHLLYLYSYKSATIGGLPNYSGTCSVVSGVRPTWVPDLVSFDASGTFNGGFALFNDPDSYGGSFALGVSGPTRSYLLVTNSNSAGVPQAIGYNWSLSGEAIILDIFAGAAWGYKALNDSTREDFGFSPAGIVNSLNTGDSVRFTFFPPSEWTTRFFVTPIGDNMDIWDLSSVVRLTGFGGSSTGSITGRGGTTYSFNVSQVVTCTGAVNLSDLMDSTAWAAIYFTGGWGWFNVVSGDAAVVYKLEYVANNPTYGGTNNNGFLLSTVDGP